MSRRSLGFDAVIGLCRHEYRRIILTTLADQRQPIPLTDLAETVAERNRQTPATAVSVEAVTRTGTALHHVHLPKVEAAALVEYDPERRLVAPTERLDRGEPHLSTLLDADSVLAA